MVVNSEVVVSGTRNDSARPTFSPWGVKRNPQSSSAGEGQNSLGRIRSIRGGGVCWGWVGGVGGCGKKKKILSALRERLGDISENKYLQEDSLGTTLASPTKQVSLRSPLRRVYQRTAHAFAPRRERLTRRKDSKEEGSVGAAR